jgi:hypothetical protein
LLIATNIYAADKKTKKESVKTKKSKENTYPTLLKQVVDSIYYISNTDANCDVCDSLIKIGEKDEFTDKSKLSF